MEIIKIYTRNKMILISLCIMTGIAIRLGFKSYNFVIDFGIYFSCIVLSLFIIVKLCLFRNNYYDETKNYKIWVCILIVFIFIGYIVTDVKCSRFDEMRNYVKTLDPDSKIYLTGIAKTVRVEKNSFKGFSISFILVLDDANIIVKQSVKNDNKIILEHLNGKNNINGETVCVIGKYAIPTHSKNPRTFNYSHFLLSKGVGLQFEAEKIFISKKSKNNRLSKEDKNKISDYDKYKLGDDEYNKISDYDDRMHGSLFKSYVLTNKRSYSNLIYRYLRDFYYQLYDSATNVRDNFLRELSSHIDKDKLAMVEAICFGNKSNMQEEVYESYQKNGTAHILATSGLHLGLLYLLLKKILFLKRQKGKSGIVLVILFFYCIMAEFTVSILRAYIMITVAIVGNVLHKRVSIVTSASFSLIIILLMNPLSILDIGLQMSFLAIYIIAMIIRKMDYQLPKNKKVTKAILATLIMQLTMLPYTIYQFNYLSLSAFVANIIVGIIGTILLVLSILLIACYFAFTIPAFMKEYIAELVDVFNYINKFIFHDGAFSFDVASPPIWFLCIFYFLLFFIFSEGYYILKHRKFKKIICNIVFAIVIISTIIGLSYSNDFDDTKVIFVDVGQGSCIFLKTDDGKNILIDGGGSENYDVGKKILKPFLLKNRISKIDYAFVTHEDVDHVDGIYSLYKDGMIDRVVLADLKISNKKYIQGKYDHKKNKEVINDREGKFKNKYVWNEKKVIRVSSGNKFNFNKNEYIDILHPSKNYDAKNINDSSLVLLISSHYKKILITGDISSSVEDMLVNNDFLKKSKIDVVSIAHHGSKHSSSDSFLKYIRANVAVVQVGMKNRFGHPSEEVLERCKKNDIILYRNDYMGAIGIINSGNKLRVITNIKDDGHSKKY